MQTKKSNFQHSKVKPVVVKHVLANNFIQKPEIYQQRPVKQPSLYSQAHTSYKASPMYSDQKSAKGEQLMHKLNMGNLNDQYPSVQTFMNGGGQPQKQVSHVGNGLVD
jgi:hypothetical protein